MRSNYTLTKPPVWQPDAVPSNEGWRHPQTGELLVSIKGGNLPPMIDETVNGSVISEKEKEMSLLDERITDSKVIDEREPEIVTLTEVKKRKPRKKKENTNAA